jgi:ABC-2 type transport system ATP-binding protein
MESVLRLHQLNKAYAEFALDHIDLEVPKGYVTGLIGPNGAGKTTTIKLIMNLIRADSGWVEVFGLKHDLHDIQIKDRVGYVGEEQFFYEQRSAAWTGNFVSHFFSAWDSDAFDHYLDRFELPPKKRIKKYSKGMKVKLSLAIALSHMPELIILDEPTSGLDPVVRREVIDLLHRTAAEEHKTVLISSHITDDIERIADYIVFMVQGRIALYASKDELQSSWKTIHFKQDSVPAAVLESLEHVETQMFGSTGITRDFSVIENLLAGIRGLNWLVLLPLLLLAYLGLMLLALQIRAHRDA